MRKKCKAIIAACLLCVACGLRCQAKEKTVPLSLTPFHYTQGFEEGRDPFVHWTTNPGKYAVNFLGITEEKAASGTKSFKLDVTFPEACYSYWRIPVKIPVEGKMAFRGRMLFLQGEQTKAGLGFNAAFPKSYLSGCGPFTSLDPSDAWQEISGDVPAMTAIWINSFQKLVLGISPDYVGTYMDQIGLFVSVGTATRVVIYVDDIFIAGEVPEAKAYEDEIARRWTLYRNGPLKKAVDELQSRLSAATKEVGTMTGMNPKARSGVTEKISQATATLAEIEKKGWISQDEYSAIERSFPEIEELTLPGKMEDLFR